MSAQLRKLWVTLQTQDWPAGGTNSPFSLKLINIGREIMLPDQPGNDLEKGDSTTFEFAVDNLSTADFESHKIVHLCNKLGGSSPDWRCKSVIVIGLGEDGKYYLVCATSDVDRWLNTSNPEMKLDLLKRTEVGLPDLP